MNDTTPCTFQLEPGAYSIQAVYHDKILQQQVTLEAGGSGTAHFNFNSGSAHSDASGPNHEVDIGAGVTVRTSGTLIGALIIALAIVIMFMVRA